MLHSVCNMYQVGQARRRGGDGYLASHGARTLETSSCDMGTDANTLHDLMLGDRLVDELDTPAVLVDLDLLERNIARMAAFAREHGVQLRPHAKSHKTLQIAERQRTAGSSGLTVAKLDEAEAFLDHGFDDLFVANEVV